MLDASDFSSKNVQLFFFFWQGGSLNVRNIYLRYFQPLFELQHWAHCSDVVPTQREQASRPTWHGNGQVIKHGSKHLHSTIVLSSAVSF